MRPIYDCLRPIHDWQRPHAISHDRFAIGQDLYTTVCDSYYDRQWPNKDHLRLCSIVYDRLRPDAVYYCRNMILHARSLGIRRGGGENIPSTIQHFRPAAIFPRNVNKFEKFWGGGGHFPCSPRLQPWLTVSKKRFNVLESARILIWRDQQHVFNYIQHD